MTPRVRFFGKIRIRIFDPRSFGSWCIKGTDESLPKVDSSVPLMHHDPSDLGSKIRIRIFQKKYTVKFFLSLNFQIQLVIHIKNEMSLLLPLGLLEKVFTTIIVGYIGWAYVGVSWVKVGLLWKSRLEKTIGWMGVDGGGRVGSKIWPWVGWG